MRILFLLFSITVSVSAQSPNGQYYGFFSVDNPPSANFGTGSVGAGADLFVYKGAAFSPSASYLFDFDNNRGLAVVTVNGSYHFLRNKGRVQPFVSAGYGALANLGGGVSLFNYGGGANYWLHKRVGFRAEILNFQSGRYRDLTSIRFGISFR